MRPHLGKMRPIWAICTKSGQKCSRIGQKKYNHGCQVLRYEVEDKRDGGRGLMGFNGWRKESKGWQVFLPIYIANMLKSLKAHPKQAVLPFALGSPQRLSISTLSVCFRLDNNAELACQDSSPHHCIKPDWGAKVNKAAKFGKWEWTN